MMELKNCALVLTLVSLVTATPYGYGVKGGAGASARADSSASAGAFGGHGDIPVAIPLGSAFSGSYSKSSASSSSSSSASSSSSSFSYSGAGAFGGHGAHGNIGCSSGLCQNSGANEISGKQGATGADTGLHGFNAANAAAVAGSGSLSGTNCNGPTCNNNSEKCSSGNCQSKITTGNGYDDSQKCTSGKCGLETGPSASTSDDSDDIGFVAHPSKGAHDSKDQASNHGKFTENSAGSGCTGGACGTPTAYNSQPDSVHGVGKPNSQNSGPAPGYHTPATDLETPKRDSSCNSGICNSGQGEPNHGGSPSSYNVPIYGTYDIVKQQPTCTDGKCNLKGGHSTTASNSLPTNYLTPQDSYSSKGPTYNDPRLKPCEGANCGSALSSQIGERPFDTGSININSNLPFSNSVTTNPTNCNLQNCKPSYAASSPIGSNGQHGQVHLAGAGHNVKPSNDHLPIYTGGFGGPAGILKPNDYTIPVTGLSSPSYTHPNTAPTVQPTLPIACYLPNCIGQTSSSGSPSSSAGSYKPVEDGNVPGQVIPTFTGGFVAPAGAFTPKPITSKPILTTSPTYNTPPFTSTGCKTPNCFSSSPVSGLTPTATTTQTGSYGTHKPAQHGPGSPDNNMPTYTGGFGGPAGLLKPDEFENNDTIKPTHSLNPSYQNQPSTATPGCKSPNCNGYASVSGANAAANAQSGSYGAIKPSSDVESSSKLPPYTGGFGGPAGVLKPNEFKVPHAGTTSHIPNYSGALPNKSPTNNNVAGCTTPNCYPSNVGSTTATHTHSPFGISKPSSAPHPLSSSSPGYTTNYDRPVGISNPISPAVAPISSSLAQPPYSAECETGNCAVKPITGESANNKPSSGSLGISQPNSNSKPSNPQYIGGFNEPSGTSSYQPHHIPSPGISSINCNTANCGNLPSAGSGADAQAGSNAGTKEQLPTYTGGFGAPAGFLKPNDYSIPATPVHSKPLTPSAGACSTGNCKPQITSPSAPGYNFDTSGSPSSQPTRPQHTISFERPSGTPNSDAHSSHVPSASSSIDCKSPNCANPLSVTAGAQSDYNSVSKEQLPAYNSGFGAPAGFLKPDHSGPVPSTAPSSPNSPPPVTSLPGACSTGNCNPKVTSPSSPGYNSVSNVASSTQQYNAQNTGSYSGSSNALKPGHHSYNVPAGGPSTIPCKTSYCASPATGGTGTNTPSGSYTGSKEQLPAYTGGFGAPTGFLRPNHSGPDPSTAPNSFNSPSPVTSLPGGCSTGNCNPEVTSPSSPGYNSVSNSASSTQQYNSQNTGSFSVLSSTVKPGDYSYNVPTGRSSTTPCITSNCASPTTGVAGTNTPSGSYTGSNEQLPAYTGGFGAPAGFLKPNEHASTTANDQNKSSYGASGGACTSGNCYSKETLPSSSGYNTASGGTHASASSAASTGVYTGGFAGPPGFLKPNDDGKIDLTKLVGGHNQKVHHGSGNINHQAGGDSNVGAIAGSAAGATAYSSSLASANSGSYGAHQGGGVKGSSPCGGGCGGGHEGGLSGTSAGAGARSVSSSGAFGIGGSFASSSASAHSSAGSYTKGGYGKR